MPQHEPRRVLQFLLNEWDVIEAIYEETRRAPIRPRRLRELAAAGTSTRIVDRLLEYGIVVPLPNSPSYEMGDVIQGIVSQLRDDHALGLADEVRVYLEDLNRQTLGLIDAIRAPDHDRLVRHIDSLQLRIKALRRQLLNNARALEEMVSAGKTRKRQLPLRQRYAEVLEAWDLYIEPIRVMVDPNGAFEVLFERLEGELKHALREVQEYGGLVSEKTRIELLLFRLMHLRGALRKHLAHTSEMLLPLVREVRANSVVARGASVILKKLQSGELTYDELADVIPLSRRAAPGVIAGREFLEAYVAALSDYEPAPQPFFAKTKPMASRPGLVDIESVRARIEREDSIPDLMQWLVDNYDASAGTDDLLDVYLSAAAPSRTRHVDRGDKIRYETRNHFVTAPRVIIRTMEEADT